MIKTTIILSLFLFAVNCNANIFGIIDQKHYIKITKLESPFKNDDTEQDLGMQNMIWKTTFVKYEWCSFEVDNYTYDIKDKDCIPMFGKDGIVHISNFGEKMDSTDRWWTFQKQVVPGTVVGLKYVVVFAGGYFTGGLATPYLAGLSSLGAATGSFIAFTGGMMATFLTVEYGNQMAKDIYDSIWNKRTMAKNNLMILGFTEDMSENDKEMVVFNRTILMGNRSYILDEKSFKSLSKIACTIANSATDVTVNLP
ncbi:MAG: hypothetical protein NTY22_03345, partial [Proteobacteria bacterium]|nr:hypothetical protein [Pseudomonadota bacterium]